MQYNIQLWASKNIFFSRILLIIIHTILGYFSYYTALNVADYLQIPLSIVFVPLLLSVLILLNYSEKEAPKAIPIVVIGLRMLFWFFVGIQLSHFADEKEITVQSEISHFASYKSETTKEIFVVMNTNKFLSLWKKLIQRDKRMVKLDSDNSGLIALIIFGTILGVIAIAYLGFLLACSLSCNGSEAAALLVVVLGILSIIGLIYLADERVFELLSKNHKKESRKLRENSIPSPPPSKPKEEILEPIIPKSNTQPSDTKKIEPPPTSKTKKSAKERRYEKCLDKGIVWAKILTVVALVGLIIFTIISSKF